MSATVIGSNFFHSWNCNIHLRLRVIESLQFWGAENNYSVWAQVRSPGLTLYSYWHTMFLQTSVPGFFSVIKLCPSNKHNARLLGGLPLNASAMKWKGIYSHNSGVFLEMATSGFAVILVLVNVNVAKKRIHIIHPSIFYNHYCCTHAGGVCWSGVAWLSSAVCRQSQSYTLDKLRIKCDRSSKSSSFCNINNFFSVKK